MEDAMKLNVRDGMKANGRGIVGFCALAGVTLLSSTAWACTGAGGTGNPDYNGWGADGALVVTPAGAGAAPGNSALASGAMPLDAWQGTNAQHVLGTHVGGKTGISLYYFNDDAAPVANMAYGATGPGAGPLPLQPCKYDGFIDASSVTHTEVPTRVVSNAQSFDAGAFSIAFNLPDPPGIVAAELVWFCVASAAEGTAGGTGWTTNPAPFIITQ